MKRNFLPIFQHLMEINKNWVLIHSRAMALLDSSVNINPQDSEFEIFIGTKTNQLFGMAAAQLINGNSPVLFLDDLQADEIIRHVRVFQNSYEFPLLILLISNFMNESLELQNKKRLKKIFRAVNMPFFSIRKLENIPFINLANELAERLQTPVIIHLDNSIWKVEYEYT